MLQASHFWWDFPGLIYKNKLFDEGAIILPVPALARPYLIDMTKGLEFEIPKDWVKRKLYKQNCSSIC